MKRDLKWTTVLSVISTLDNYVGSSVTYMEFTVPIIIREGDEIVKILCNNDKKMCKGCGNRFFCWTNRVVSDSS